MKLTVLGFFSAVKFKSINGESLNIVITTVASCYYMLRSILQNGTVVDLLRSNADLATDLYLGSRCFQSPLGKSQCSRLLAEHAGRFLCRQLYGLC